MEICIIFSIIVLSLFSSNNSVKFVNAFDFAFPEIPFLNFNFKIGGDTSNSEPESSSKDYSISDKIDTFDSVSDEDATSGNDEGPTNKFSLADELNNDGYSDDKIVRDMPYYESLPFPSNLVKESGYDTADEQKQEDNESTGFKQLYSMVPVTLPLIADYNDIPSSLLTASDVAPGKIIPNQYIVVLKDDDTNISEFISDISGRVELQGVELLQIYENVLKGLAIKVPNDKVIEAIERLPMVDHVENDVMTQAFAQTLPTGINRIDADMSSTKSGNGAGSVEVDVAVIDSGIDLKHSDLNVYHQKSFVSSSSSGGYSSLFKTSTPPTANDDNGHGTHVAGIIGAKDNSIGSVGVVPGAKLWAIKVLDSKGAGPLSTVIKGIDYVTSYANQIEVANLSLGCECKSSAFDTAINNAVKAGIVFVVAGGNAGKDARTFSPANNPNVLAVSAIADSDGKCGGKGPSTGYGNDDTLASFSNYGSVIDFAAPGAKIFSTYKGNGYATMSGTSMASPHVAGAAALYMASHPDASLTEVRSGLMSQASLSGTSCDGNGHGYFTGDKDNSKEPLLYVRNN
jgi:subtilisin family serine protease